MSVIAMCIICTHVSVSWHFGCWKWPKLFCHMWRFFCVWKLPILTRQNDIYIGNTDIIPHSDHVWIAWQFLHDRSFDDPKVTRGKPQNFFATKFIRFFEVHLSPRSISWSSWHALICEHAHMHIVRPPNNLIMQFYYVCDICTSRSYWS